ncbi:hypothetical protein CC80DRAFT_385944, partial [Byssothecium circinans]
FVTVVVGANLDKFVVHEALLIRYSKFFRAALTNGMKETQEKAVTLADEGPETFELFVHWLYYRRFPDAAKGDNQELVDLYTNVNDKGCLETRHLVLLFIFGDRYIIPGLKQDSIDALYHYVCDKENIYLPQFRLVRFAFENLPSTSPMCSVLVDLYCYFQRPDAYDDVGENELPPSALLALLARYTSLAHKGETSGKGEIEYELNLCDYHEHETDEEKKACKANQRKKN